MEQNAPYLCIAKRVTGHEVYSNVCQMSAKKTWQKVLTRKLGML